MTKRKALTITSIVAILFASAAFGGADGMTQQGWDEGYKYWLDAGLAPETKQSLTPIQDRYHVFYVDRETGAMLDGDVAALDDVDAELPLALVQNGNDVFYVDMQAGTTTKAGAIWDGNVAALDATDAKQPLAPLRNGNPVTYVDRETGAILDGDVAALDDVDAKLPLAMIRRGNYFFYVDVETGATGKAGAANDLRDNVIRVSTSQH